MWRTPKRLLSNSGAELEGGDLFPRQNMAQPEASNRAPLAPTGVVKPTRMVNNPNFASPLLNREVTMTPALYTPRQGQFLAFIHAYTQLHGQPPAEADMQRHFRVTPPTIHSMVLLLESKQLIARTPGMPRSIRVLLKPEQLPPLE